MTNRKLWSGKTGTVTCFGRCTIKYDQLKMRLGEEHFVEDDPTRTHSGTERYWVFEICDGVALAFQYHDITNELLVGSNRNLKEPLSVAFKFLPVSLEEINGTMWS